MKTVHSREKGAFGEEAGTGESGEARRRGGEEAGHGGRRVPDHPARFAPSAPE